MYSANRASYIVSNSYRHVEMTMRTTCSEIEQQARSLSPDERARLAEVLIVSLCERPLVGIEAVWKREIEERVAAYDREKVQIYPAESLFAEARRIDG